MIDKKQMSESFVILFLLTFSGGFQDAYTYFCRGKVFANAQTGNIVLMSANFFDGNIINAFQYFIPFLFFAIGVFVSDQICLKYKQSSKIHWRQIILIIEIILLFICGLLPDNLNLLSNSLVSFACAMQVQAFRKAHGNAYASTMCIGNLRSAMDALSKYKQYKNTIDLHRSFRYFRLILIFFLGAGIGKISVTYFNYKAIWISCLMLFTAFIVMFKSETFFVDPLLKKEILAKIQKEKKIQSLYQSVYDLEMKNNKQK